MAHRLVVHCKRAQYDVLIDRTTKWGNPHHISAWCTREEVIARFRADIMNDPVRLAECRAELRGKRLGCWCAPLPCHGDVLAEIANPVAPNPLAAWFSGAKAAPPPPFVPPRWDTLDGLPPPPPAPPSPPLEPRPPRFCRYHPTLPATAAVVRRGGTVLLCRCCGEQVREGTLTILDAMGRHRGEIIPF